MEKIKPHVEDDLFDLIACVYIAIRQKHGETPVCPQRLLDALSFVAANTVYIGAGEREDLDLKESFLASFNGFLAVRQGGQADG